MKIKENQRLELKKSLSDIKSILECVVAFANTKGGKILIGIDEKTGKVNNIPIGSNTIENLANKITKTIYPPIYPEINIKTIDGKTIIEMDVPESKNKPHFYNSFAYARVGTSNIKMDPQQIEQLIKQRINRENILNLTDMNVNIEDLDRSAIKKYIDELKQSRRINIDEKADVKEILSKLDLIKDGKLINLTALLFAKNPSKFFQYFTFKCAVSITNRFDIDALKDIKEYDLPFVFLVEEVSKYIFMHLPKKIKLEGIRRVEEPIIGMGAIREIVVNSIIHRDYSIKSPNYVLITSEYLEVSNPGNLPDDISINELYKMHKSILRNSKFAHIAYLAGYVDTWGSGTNKIVSECAKNKLIVEFKNEGPFFNVKIRFSLEDVYKRIIDKLSENRKTVVELSKNLKIPERTLRRHLNYLIDRGIIIREKKGKRVFYSL